MLDLKSNRLPSIPLLIVSALVCTYAVYTVHFAEKLESDVIAWEASRSEKHPTYSERDLTWDANKRLGRMSEVVYDDGIPPLPYDIQLQFIADNGEFVSVILDDEQQIASEGDALFDTNMTVLEIADASIIVLYGTYEYRLLPLYRHRSTKAEKPAIHAEEDFTKMTAKDIGTQPKIIAHVVRLIPTPYIADGMIADEGVNPKLFQQAGLKADDVIKKINGKVVANAEQFDEFERQFHTYDTLVFEIERKGRKMTLYLDIPGDSLEISR